MTDFLPTGKLPPDLLLRLLRQAPTDDPRLLVGPGVGLDCAVVEAGEELLVFKTDPITFATDEIGWYAVQINANDIATTAARPRWFMSSLMLPENSTTPALVEQIAGQVYQACRELGIAYIGGHTEVTYGLDRPILSGTMVGTVSREKLVTPRGAQEGDRLLLTKGIPIEATSILARELPQPLSRFLSAAELEEARNYLHQPGISVVRDAQVALQAGAVHAMHDPTEGGLAGALWELAEACGHHLWVEPEAVPVPELPGRICAALGLEPLATIASGALLLATPADSAGAIQSALKEEGIACAEIGAVEGPAQEPAVWAPGGRFQEADRAPLPRPVRDEIARLFAEQ